MPTDLPPRIPRNPLRTLCAALCALALLVPTAAEAQLGGLGIAGPSAPTPAYILLGQGRGYGAASCAAASGGVYDHNARRGQEANPGGAAPIDPRTGEPCPVR
jgi:hypothetical protein